MKAIIHNKIYENIRNFLNSEKAGIIAFLWGLSEATFFFVVPDVFFLFAVLFWPKRGIILGLISITGSLLGGLIMYNLALINPSGMNFFLTKIPAITEKMVAHVNIELQFKGLQSMLSAPLQGIPYKIYAVQAALLKINILKFLSFTIPSRLERVLVLCSIVGILGVAFRSSIKNKAKYWVFLYSGIWICFYGVYVYSVRIRY